ncbi:DUF3306 domain-containing protein [Rhodoferax sp.]|uniref:DUF3306 domain-containing protein n=1 Tax=Rhodoferax sp. TaxID=50421 RepID=UPI002AB9C99C|nr:DUF3306 domain-containing protein [Rhodoferax sp.]MDZ4207607.1 DUF3306 domain-containing protein [Rhodoferax sp.]
MATAGAVAVADGFLGRWSQRKQALREGRVVDEPVAPKPAGHTEPAAPAVPASAPPAPESKPPEAIAKAPAPTLADVQALQADSSFAPFVARDVAPEVRNAAMKKLFTDPHYNVMDGLDIYIDDYSLPSPMPAAMLRQMASAKFLKLFDEEEQAPADQAATPVISESAVAVSDSNPDPHHDHTDLRLQPDPAARPAGPEREPERALDPAFEPVPPPSR